MQRLLSLIVKRSLLVSLALAATAAPPAWADHVKLKVAVVPSIAVNLDAAKVDALCQDLADALVAELDVDAVGGLDVRRKLPADLPPDCATTPTCATDVASRLAAAQLLFVVMVDSGTGSVQVETTWVDPASGRHATRPAIDLASVSDADAKTKFVAAAHRLLPDAPARPKPTSATGPKLVNANAVPRHFTMTSKLTAVGAIATLGAGVALGLATRAKYNACANDPTCAIDTNDSRRGTIRALGIATDASFLVAIGCLTATAILYATSGESAHVMVAPSPGGIAFAAVRSF